MANVEHKDATQVHKGRYIQSSDPGAVGSGVEWLDTTTTPAIHKKRNAGDSGWDEILDPADYALLASPTFTGTPAAPTAAGGTNTTQLATTAFVKAAIDKQPEVLMVAVSDESTAITTGTAKITFRMPFGMLGSAVRANVNTVSSSGLVTVDIKKGGVTIFSTLLTIDASEKTSVTAATPAVLSDTAWTDDAEMAVDITVAGTGAKGLKLAFLGTRT